MPSSQIPPCQPSPLNRIIIHTSTAALGPDRRKRVMGLGAFRSPRRFASQSEALGVAPVGHPLLLKRLPSGQPRNGRPPARSALRSHTDCGCCTERGGRSTFKSHHLIVKDKRVMGLGAFRSPTARFRSATRPSRGRLSLLFVATASMGRRASLQVPSHRVFKESG